MDDSIYRYIRGALVVGLLPMGFYTWLVWYDLMCFNWYKGLSFFEFLVALYTPENDVHVEIITEMRISFIILAVMLIGIIVTSLLIRFGQFRKKPEDPSSDAQSGDGLK